METDDDQFAKVMREDAQTRHRMRDASRSYGR